MGLSMVALLFASCSKDDVTLSGVKLDQAAVSVMVEDSTTLKATLEPSGADGSVVWSTSDASVATVRNGVVKGIKIGTATVTATVGSFTANCTVTVTENTDFSRSLKGSNYYLVIMDGVSAASIPAAKITADFRPDDVTKFLYVWNNTYNAGTVSGPNFYSEVEGWTSFVVGSVGWSGAGFFCKDGTLLDKMTDITTNPSEYYLHIGIRSKDKTTHLFGVDGQSTAKFAIGSTTYVDGNDTYQPVADFTRDGEWHEIEIPVTTLVAKGLLYSSGTNAAGKNVIWFLSGGTAGATLDIDAVFFYKKAK